MIIIYSIITITRWVHAETFTQNTKVGRIQMCIFSVLRLLDVFSLSIETFGLIGPWSMDS